MKPDIDVVIRAIIIKCQMHRKPTSDYMQTRAVDI